MSIAVGVGLQPRSWKRENGRRRLQCVLPLQSNYQRIIWILVPVEYNYSTICLGVNTVTSKTKKLVTQNQDSGYIACIFVQCLFSASLKFWGGNNILFFYFLFFLMQQKREGRWWWLWIMDSYSKHRLQHYLVPSIYAIFILKSYILSTVLRVVGNLQHISDCKLFTMPCWIFIL